MLITENFALLNILKALEKLSAASDRQKSTANDSAAEVPEQNPPAPSEKNGREDSQSYAESLIQRHEQTVNRIKNGKGKR